MAELPKDIDPYGGVGLFISDLLPYAEGGDIKIRVTNMRVSRTLVAIHSNHQNAPTTEGGRLWQRLLHL
jgi:hypothetical protein